MSITYPKPWIEYPYIKERLELIEKEKSNDSSPFSWVVEEGKTMMFTVVCTDPDIAAVVFRSAFEPNMDIIPGFRIESVNVNPNPHDIQQDQMLLEIKEVIDRYTNNG